MFAIVAPFCPKRIGNSLNIDLPLFRSEVASHFGTENNIKLPKLVCLQVGFGPLGAKQAYTLVDEDTLGTM